MGGVLCKFTVRTSFRVFPSVQKAGNLLKRLFFHFGYQKLEEINCHNRSYPKRAQAISFLFLAREELEKLFHIIIHKKKNVLAFQSWVTAPARPTDVIGTRSHAYMYSCTHLPLISCDAVCEAFCHVYRSTRVCASAIGSASTGVCTYRSAGFLICAAFRRCTCSCAPASFCTCPPLELFVSKSVGANDITR